MKVCYASRALRDIDDILGYIKTRSPHGARSVSFAIEHAIRTLCAQPAHAGQDR
jgi:plasmid stabilization system protein ParE